MKKLILILFILAISKILFAQTNTFPSSGNVGIGTTSPGADLELYKSSGSKKMRFVGNNYGYSFEQPADSPYFILRRDDADNSTLISWDGSGSATFYNSMSIYKASGSKKIKITSDNYGFALEQPSDSPYLVLRRDDGYTTTLTSWNSSGDALFPANVGIGTTSPDSKLAVNGTIHSKEVKVDLTGWSDFVFEPYYKLRGLKETEQFIRENKHLPEIPSAKEVTDNGINLGEMNAKLLQKIEELTLYLIEQSKENKEQGAKIKDLQKQINQLKSKR